MTLSIVKHEEGWVADISGDDQVQVYFNGAPIPSTLVTVPSGSSGRIYFRYNIENGT